MNKSLFFFGAILVAIACFSIYNWYVRQKEVFLKTKECGENLAKMLTNNFFSISPKLRGHLHIVAHVEKPWRWEKWVLRRFSRVIIDITLLSEEIDKNWVKEIAIDYTKETNKQRPKFLVGLKITTNQENGGIE